MKVLAVGDLHRKHQYLAPLRSFFERGNYDKIVFTGDYTDDFLGNSDDSYKILSDLKKWSEEVNTKDDHPLVLLMGNHDFAYFYRSWTLDHGQSVHLSGGFIEETEPFIVGDFHDFVENFQLWEEIDGVYYTHAGISESIDIEQYPKTCNNLATEQILELWDRNSPLHIRPENYPTRDYDLAIHPEGYENYANVPQVFGHTSFLTCTKASENPVRFGIDSFSYCITPGKYGDRSILEIIDGKNFRVVKETEWLGDFNIPPLALPGDNYYKHQ